MLTHLRQLQLDDLNADLRDALTDKAKLFGRPSRDVDDAPLHKRTAVINLHDDGAAVVVFSCDLRWCNPFVPEHANESSHGHG